MRVAQNPSAVIGKGRYITDQHITGRYITGMAHAGQIPPIRRELGITNCRMGLGCFSKCERIQPRPGSYQEKAAAFC